MNEANEMLVAIQRKKAIYRKCMEDSNDVSERRKYQRDIDILSEEETYWLGQLL